MQTVSSLVERLDMSAEMAVEKLRYMLYEVESVDSEITDELCDILIDVNDDPDLAERIRKKRQDDIEKAQKRNARLKESAKKAAAAKRKEKEKQQADVEVEIAPTSDIADDSEPAEVDRPEVAEIIREKDLKPAAEIIHADETVETPAAPKPPKKEKEKKEPAIIIGTAVSKDEPRIQIVRADGTALEAHDEKAEQLLVVTAEAPVEVEEDKQIGLLAEAERRQEEEEERRARQRSHIKPDPAVVEEVKRKAAERMRKLQAERSAPVQQAGPPSRSHGGASPAAVQASFAGGISVAAPSGPPPVGVPSGKTARKKQKKQEKYRAEESKRRNAAAAIREYQSGSNMGPRKKKRRKDKDESVIVQEEDVFVPKPIEVDDAMTVEELANVMEIPVNEIILALMDQNILATKNQALTLDQIRGLAEPKGYDVQLVIREEEELFSDDADDPGDLVPRAPVVTVMGHVDHGKTSLLDHVRRANVAAGEAGGITQHIAAYDVPIGDQRLVFLDTPGHEAFTAMRARGAGVTDLVVLVVAADDGVKPQTIEAIDHAKAANVPIVVAINKCDKPDAQPDRVRQELTKYELIDESWGGKTSIKNISAKNGVGIDELMEVLVLEAEILELKANPRKRSRGTVVEAELSKGFGPVAWVLVQNGTLRVGDVFLAGTCAGRVRNMFNSRGESIQEAGPSTPVLVTGFDETPNAGDTFMGVEDERVARSIAEKRSFIARQKQERSRVRHVTLEDFHERMLAGEKSELNVLIKADVQGSVDALISSLAKVGNAEVQVKVVHSGVGGINESDVLLASASDAVILGFHVTANPKVQKLAEQEGVDIRTYRIIYELIENVRLALEGMLTPDKKEVITGNVEVRAVFRSSAHGNIAGCYVVSGEVTRGNLARIIRDDVIVYQGRIGSLRREKDDVRSVASGFECGVKLENYEDVKEGDIIQLYREDSIKKTLE
ncbi:MAG: translation initiation factor IF-2 [Candidatus Hydrogenedentota bacterium]